MKTWQKYKSDPEYRRRIEQRAKIVETIRGFFALQGFVEIDAPLLVAAPGMEPNLTQFKTILTSPYPLLSQERAKQRDAYLITSPEYACKKMLAAGVPKLFSIGKVFRNEEPWGGTHNPEFTMIEWYRAGADYRSLMDDTENLVRACASAIGLNTKHEARSTKQGFEIQNSNFDIVSDFGFRISDLFEPWKRVSVKDAFAQIGINLDECLTRDTMAEAAQKKGYAVSSTDTFDDCFFKIFLTEIEPKLGAEKPTILYDYPVQMASLSRPKPEDPRYAERFEAYVGGLELCNAFSELIDVDEQRRRLEEEQRFRVSIGKEKLPIDEDFLVALKQMPPAAGNALGVDRLVMLLTGAKSIEDVILFPASDLF